MATTGTLKAHDYKLLLMGCSFTITAIHADPDRAWDGIRAAVAEIARIERLISSWKPDSQTSRINEQAGIAPVRVDAELFQLIRRSLEVSRITEGAFDISGTLARYYWDFNGAESSIPSPEKTKELRDLINYNHILLDKAEQSVFLAKKGMKIGFGGIGKGYAAYRARQVMLGLGIEAGMVNASGDLLCWGKPLADKPWEIVLLHPDDTRQVLATLHLEGGSVVTSGGYESYALIDGKKYSHIIDPRTGFPVEGLESVSVICPNPELGDALATAISVMGAGKGLALINQLNGIECILVDTDKRILHSDNIQL